MAQRTIAPGGGNINVAATFVEVAVPGTGDFIVGNASSGQLTVNVNTTVQRVDFTGYTAVLTINNAIFLRTTLAGSTSTFSAAGTYNFIGTGEISRAGGTQSIAMLGTTPIPRYNNNVSNMITILTDFHVIQMQSSNNNLDIGGTHSVFISGGINMGFNQNNSNAPNPAKLRFVGSGSIIMLQVNRGEFIIDTAGTYTISGPIGSPNNAIGLGLGNANQPIFRHLAGTIINPRFRNTMNSQPITLDLISGTKWNCISDYTAATVNTAYTFLGSPEFDMFIIPSRIGSGIGNFVLGGTCSLSVNDFYITSSYANSIGNFFMLAMDLAIATGLTMSINKSLNLNFGPNYNAGAPQFPLLEVRSNTPGTQANIVLNTFTQSVSNTRFTDINFSSGNTLFGQGNTFSNSTNIQEFTLPPSGGGGGGGGSFVYLT